MSMMPGHPPANEPDDEEVLTDEEGDALTTEHGEPLEVEKQKEQPPAR